MTKSITITSNDEFFLLKLDGSWGNIKHTIPALKFNSISYAKEYANIFGLNNYNEIWFRKEDVIKVECKYFIITYPLFE